MKILDRYVLIAFLKNYVIALAVLLGLYIVLDMVFNFDELVDVRGPASAAYRIQGNLPSQPPAGGTVPFSDIQNSDVTRSLTSLASAMGASSPDPDSTVVIATVSNLTTWTIVLPPLGQRTGGMRITVDSSGMPAGTMKVPFSVLPPAVSKGLANVAAIYSLSPDASQSVDVRTIGHDIVFSIDVSGTAQGLAGVAQIMKGIGDYYFYQSFLIFAHLSGVIPVVAVAFTLIRLSRFNELSAILAAGVPLLRISAPIVFAALGLNVLLFVDQESVIPEMIPKLTRSHDQVQQGLSNYAKGYPIQAMQDVDRSLLLSTRFTPAADDEPAHMIDLDVIERDDHLLPTAHISADRADWDARKKEWTLLNGRCTTGLQPDTERSDELPWPAWRTNITPDEIALYRSNDFVELLSTARINELLTRPQSYGTVNLLTVKQARVTQWLMNLVLVLLSIPCVLTREPGKLKQDLTKLMFLSSTAMGTIFICHQIAAHPPGTGHIALVWPAVFAWVPVFLFTPTAIYLLDRLHTRGS